MVDLARREGGREVQRSRVRLDNIFRLLCGYLPSGAGTAGVG